MTISHPIEHTVGIYIGLLLLACVVGIVSKLLTKLPYTVFLTVVGLLIGIFRFGPEISETGFGYDLIFFVFLPPLLFHGGFHIELNRLLSNLGPIVCFAIPGVLVSTLLVGGVLSWWGGVSSLMVAMLFGALISPTDPVSVLALFREAKAPEDLRILVEGESLLNDATGVVLFTIILNAILKGTELSPAMATLQFIRVSGGGVVLGIVLGWLALVILRRLDDHLLENAICLVLTYGCFWLAEVLHFSGVIATVVGGLLIGNHGRRWALSENTTSTIETFFESIDFLLNSVLFILIGLELREIPSSIIVNPVRLVCVAIVAMLVGRAAVSYSFYWALNKVGRRRPPEWKHILFWGGLRGTIPIALLLSLPVGGSELLSQWRPALLLAGFGCVCFSLIVQAVTMKPLMRKLKIGVES